MSIFLCKSKQTAMTKSGKPYDNVILQDKTGTLDAKIWDVGSSRQLRNLMQWIT